MDMNAICVNDYLARITERLKTNGFVISNNKSYKGQLFDFIAKRKRFEMERFGFFTTIFLFSSLNNPSLKVLNDFSTKSFQYAIQSDKLHFTRGFLYGILCIPVAIIDDVDEDMIKVIHNSDFPKHWAASEKLVVFSTKTNGLYYSEKTPDWGSMYHNWDRQFIKEMLTP